jgi:hypothetical protein
LWIGDVALDAVKLGWRIFSRGDRGAVTVDHSAATRPLMMGPTWGIRPSIHPIFFLPRLNAPEELMMYENREAVLRGVSLLSLLFESRNEHLEVYLEESFTFLSF